MTEVERQISIETFVNLKRFYNGNPGFWRKHRYWDGIHLTPKMMTDEDSRRDYTFMHRTHNMPVCACLAGATYLVGGEINAVQFYLQKHAGEDADIIRYNDDPLRTFADIQNLIESGLIYYGDAQTTE